MKYENGVIIEAHTFPTLGKGFIELKKGRGGYFLKIKLDYSKTCLSNSKITK